MAHGRKATSVVAPRSKFYHGPFGRICSDLEPWHPPGLDPNKDPQALETHFMNIANTEMIDDDSVEFSEQSNIPAGYTYFGQFVDHDITFDPASSLMRQNDPQSLFNFRTPRLDLDNVYGRGPDDSPYLFDRNDLNAQGRVDKLLIGQIAGTNLPDLPRNQQGRALIGDMRNDENSLVSQMQLAFLLAHNTLADRARAQGVEDTFEAARCSLRWLYQWVVWNDFMRRISVDAVYKQALRKVTTKDGRTKWVLGMGDVYNYRNRPFIPVEFAVAAYRFGHSMVRNSYQTNQPHQGFGNFKKLFEVSGDDLRGFRPMHESRFVQWDWFLNTTSSGGPFPQMSMKINTKLSPALTKLPGQTQPMNLLAFRNLLRGVRMELPSGKELAKKWCLKPVNIPDTHDSLWFYILKEAENLVGANKGNMLGRMGSIIVSATFAGLLKGDPKSWINMQPCWTPDDDPLLNPAIDDIDAGVNGQSWTLASIIRLSGLPVAASDF